MIETAVLETGKADASKERADFILERLGASFEEMRGGKSLDIGCGDGEVGIEGTKLGLDIVSLDVDPYRAKADSLMHKAFDADAALREEYQNADEDHEEAIFEKYYALAKGMPLEIPNFIQGDAKELPFPDNSFKTVLCHGFPPIFSGTPEERQAYLKEMYRVLAPGGTARFGPVLWISEAEEPVDFDSLPFPITKGPLIEEENLRSRFYSFTK